MWLKQQHLRAYKQDDLNFEVGKSQRFVMISCFPLQFHTTCPLQDMIIVNSTVLGMRV